MAAIHKGEEEQVSLAHKEALKLVLSLESLLKKLESGEDTSIFLQGRLATNLNQLERLHHDLTLKVKRLPASERDLWRIKVKNLGSKKKVHPRFYGTIL